MKDYLKYYRPKLGESWLIMLAILLVAGSIVTGSIVFITNLISPDLLSLTGTGWSTPLIYVLPFLVVFHYIYLRSRQSFYEAVRTDRAPYPDPPAKLGKVPLLLYILLLPVIIVSMSLIMDPLTEWLETPAGVVAQIQGHKPSATAEKHYKRRPVDLLRVHHERIEAWILEQAGVQFTPAKVPRLSVVG